MLFTFGGRNKCSSTFFHTWNTTVFNYINDLPDSNPDVEGIGFAVDYKFIVPDQPKLDRRAKKFEDWCRLNGMGLNSKNASC